jgi:hypothetical protein
LFRVVGDDRRTARRDAPSHDLGKGVHLAWGKKPQDHALPPIALAALDMKKRVYHRNFPSSAKCSFWRTRFLLRIDSNLSVVPNSSAA